MFGRASLCGSRDHIYSYQNSEEGLASLIQLYTAHWSTWIEWWTGADTSGTLSCSPWNRKQCQSPWWAYPGVELGFPIFLSTPTDWTHFARALQILQDSRDDPSFPFPLTPIIGHPDFVPSISDRAFRLQPDQGLVRASSFLGPSEWIDPSSLYPTHNSSILGRWKISQLSHFLRSLPDHGCFRRQPT